jgi:hypothetical protein
VSESIFTSQTPGTTDANDGVGYTLCTLFSSAVDGQVTGIRWYFPSTLPSVAKGGLFQRSGAGDGGVHTELARATFLGPVAGTWNTVNFASPVNITAGTLYYAAVYTADHYVATSAGLSGAISNGNLTAPADSGSAHNGRFKSPTADLAGPDSQFNAGLYFADVLFTAAGGLSGTLAGTAGAATGAIAGSVPTIGAMSGTLSGATGAIVASTPAPVVTAHVPSPGWGGYLNIVREAGQLAAAERAAPPLACPNDGEPLRSKDGILWCPFDGYRWPE